MKLPRVSNPRRWIAAAAAAAVALIAVVDAGRTSPGPLSGVHARLPELQGRSGCAECHGGWRSTMRSACLECHAEIGAHVDLEVGLHGTLEEDLVERCGLCHSEHHGPGFAVVNRTSFREAGVGDPAAFDHAVIGWEMRGRHLEQACSACHEHADAGLLPEGAHRFLGLDRDCGSCHEDPHEGAMRLACAQCHGQEDFLALEAPGHDRFLPLRGGHADLSCSACHADGEPHALAVVGGRGDLPDPRACADCHEDPHDPGFLQRVALALRRPAGAACVECHAPDHETFRDEALTVPADLHALSGFALDAPHADVACAACHGPSDASFERRHPGRGPDACSACHADPHGGQFATGPFSTGDCLACHERLAFEPHAFDLEDHARAALVLDGAHLETACEACHEVPKPGAPRVFRGTPSHCDGCHRDAHEGFFAPHAAELGRAEHGLCAACHGTAAFGDGREEFDHARFTRFPLEGAHRQASCETCHPRAAEPDVFGRTFGRAIQRFGGSPQRFLAVDGCASCHADPHQGEFDVPGLPRQVEGRSGCARCHTTSSFRALAAGWDHRRWTGFALDGAHGRADCTVCHPAAPPAARSAAPGRTWERAAGDRCADCHADPHAGQFARGGATSCERCHETSEGWDVLDFDHERDARFPLGEAHAEVACASCHLPAEEGAGPVIYRPLDSTCVACHGTLDGPALKRRGR